ncbi:MAG: hypothetical protein DHS20C18_44430 [Saprospiraceae bacterium]|nr:MAG: hypothetical protein DHS20C18_44430 [Saprospiraceae bacterium]
MITAGGNPNDFRQNFLVSVAIIQFGDCVCDIFHLENENGKSGTIETGAIPVFDYNNHRFDYTCVFVLVELCANKIL